jgi:hypothetical protein
VDPGGREFTVSGTQAALVGVAVLGAVSSVAFGRYVRGNPSTGAAALQNAEKFLYCWGDCIEDRKLGGPGLSGDLASLVPPILSALPKQLLGVRPRGFDRAPPGRNLTNIIHAVARKLKSAGIIKESLPARIVGDRLSRVFTPVTIFEGFFDWGVIVNCAVSCDAACPP